MRELGFQLRSVTPKPVFHQTRLSVRSAAGQCPQILPSLPSLRDYFSGFVFGTREQVALLGWVGRTEGTGIRRRGSLGKPWKVCRCWPRTGIHWARLAQSGWETDEVRGLAKPIAFRRDGRPHLFLQSGLDIYVD